MRGSSAPSSWRAAQPPTRSRPTSSPRRPSPMPGRPRGRVSARAARPHSPPLGGQLPAPRRREAARRQPAQRRDQERGGRPRRRCGRTAHLDEDHAQLGIPRVRRRDDRGAARRGPLPDPTAGGALGRRQAARPLAVRPRSAPVRGGRGHPRRRSGRGRAPQTAAHRPPRGSAHPGGDGPRRRIARGADVHGAGAGLEQGRRPRALGDGAPGPDPGGARRRRGDQVAQDRRASRSPSGRRAPGGHKLAICPVKKPRSSRAPFRPSNWRTTRPRPSPSRPRRIPPAPPASSSCSPTPRPTPTRASPPRPRSARSTTPGPRRRSPRPPRTAPSPCAPPRCWRRSDRARGAPR